MKEIKRYGRLLVKSIYRKEYGSIKRLVCLCDCSCGKTIECLLFAVKSGHTKSCGCLHKEIQAKRMYIHGCSKNRTPTYNTWALMRKRCLDPNDGRYESYGGRGISICDRWSDFNNFRSDMGDREFGYSIERLNNDGPYSPENCKWIPVVEQTRNTRKNVWFEYEGTKMIRADWARRLGCHPDKITKLIKNGLSFAQVVEKLGG